MGDNPRQLAHRESLAVKLQVGRQACRSVAGGNVTGLALRLFLRFCRARSERDRGLDGDRTAKRVDCVEAIWDRKKQGRARPGKRISIAKDIERRFLTGNGGVSDKWRPDDSTELSAIDVFDAVEKDIIEDLHETYWDNFRGEYARAAESWHSHAKAQTRALENQSLLDPMRLSGDPDGGAGVRLVHASDSESEEGSDEEYVSEDAVEGMRRTVVRDVTSERRGARGGGIWARGDDVDDDVWEDFIGHAFEEFRREEMQGVTTL